MSWHKSKFLIPALLIFFTTPALAADDIKSRLDKLVPELNEYGYAIEHNDHGALSNINIPEFEESGLAFSLVNHLRSLTNQKAVDTTKVRQALVGLAKLSANLPEASKVVGRALASRYIVDFQSGALDDFEMRSYVICSRDVLSPNAGRFLQKAVIYLDKKLALNGDPAKRAMLNAEITFILDDVILPEFTPEIVATTTDPELQKATLAVDAALRLLALAEVPAEEFAKWKEFNAGRFTFTKGVAQDLRLTDFVVTKPELVRANLLPVLMAVSTDERFPNLRQRILVRFHALYGSRLGPTLDLLPNSLMVQRASNLGQLYSASYMALRGIVEPFNSRAESLLVYHPVSDFADRSPGAYQAIYQELAGRVTSVFSDCFDSKELRTTSKVTEILRSGRPHEIVELVAKARIPMLMAH